jgi:hypothetical protein
VVAATVARNTSSGLLLILGWLDLLSVVIALVF